MKLCLRCRKPAVPNRAHCADCLVKQRQEAKTRRQKLLTAGLCACGKPLAPNRAHCEDCLEYLRQTNNARRQRLKATGLCVQCGGKPAIQGKTHCQKCSDRRNRLYMARYQARVEQGICIDCAGAIDTETKFCSACLAKRRRENKQQRERGSKHAAKIRDGFQCRICKRTKSLCVHHIDGSSGRHPETHKRQRQNDNLDNLITLCRGCHGALTRFIGNEPQLAIELISLAQVPRPASEP